MTWRDTLRGHALVPTPDELRALPGLYATEGTTLQDKVVQLHFFCGACDWYLVEVDHDDLSTAFGYVNLGDAHCAEWGYFSLTELASTEVPHPAGTWLLIERDLYWEPIRFGDIERLR